MQLIDNINSVLYQVCGIQEQYLGHCSVAQSWLTLCDSMDCSIPGFPVLHHLPELAQIHVHQVSGALYSILMVAKSNAYSQRAC